MNNLNVQGFLSKNLPESFEAERFLWQLYVDAYFHADSQTQAALAGIARIRPIFGPARLNTFYKTELTQKGSIFPSYMEWARLALVNNVFVLAPYANFLMDCRCKVFVSYGVVVSEPARMDGTQFDKGFTMDGPSTPPFVVSSYTFTKSNRSRMPALSTHYDFVNEYKPVRMAHLQDVLLDLSEDKFQNLDVVRVSFDRGIRFDTLLQLDAKTEDLFKLFRLESAGVRYVPTIGKDALSWSVPQPQSFKITLNNTTLFSTTLPTYTVVNLDHTVIIRVPFSKLVLL